MASSTTLKDVTNKTNSHPSYSEMVNTAIKELNEFRGSSSQKIKNYISKNYEVDEKNCFKHIKFYLHRAEQKGILKQKGGYFKIVKTKEHLDSHKKALAESEVARLNGKSKKVYLIDLSKKSDTYKQKIEHTICFIETKEEDGWITMRIPASASFVKKKELIIKAFNNIGIDDERQIRGRLSENN